VIHHPLVIIGAGLSGLTAAYRLKEQGLIAHVYEARQRVGGRILSAHINNTIGELGAENVFDGGECTNLLKLIDDLKLQTKSGKQVMMTRYDTGTTFINRTEELRKYAGLPKESELPVFLSEIAKRCNNMAEVLQELFPDHPTLRHLFALFLMGYEGASAGQLSTFYAQTLPRWIENAYRTDDDPAYFEYMLIEGGSAQLVETMRATLADQIHLGMSLQALAQSTDGRYLLRFENGQEISADRLVLSIPCKTYENISFDPQVLAPNKLQHIQNVSYGDHSKILVPLDASKLPGGVFVNDRFGTFSFNPQLLTMYYLTQTQGFDQDHIAQLFKQDSPFITKAYHVDVPSNQSAVYAQDKHFIHYNSPFGYNWSSDPYARGSYSCIGAGQDDIFTGTTEYCGEKVKQLFSPINDTLFFAGEHTSTLMDGIGTMEAAVEGGERTARLIQNVFS
jgi:monoamine oxidase